MAKTKKIGSKFLKGQEIDNMENVTAYKKQKRKPQNTLGEIHLKEIQPLTENQSKVFDSYDEGKNIICSGFPGCGKTFLAMYLALDDILFGESGFENIVIIRSLVKSREIGHLPGSAEEKASAFEAPYKGICNELCRRGDAYEILKKKDIIRFESTSFLRGITYSNCIVIVDEFENMNFQELDTICGRIGSNCRLLLCGDLHQSDLINTREKSGFEDFMKIASRMYSFEIVEFEIADVVRSGFVYEYLMAKHGIT
jgi:phosphate starvation-inducible protein PhoH